VQPFGVGGVWPEWLQFYLPVRKRNQKKF
jgi:hypothetical protein